MTVAAIPVAGMSLLYMFMLGDSEPGTLRIGISRR
jgi:hypothetical protein